MHKSQSEKYTFQSYKPIWIEKRFVIKKVNNTTPWMYVIEEHSQS